MASEWAMEIAAQVWCKPTTEKIEMDVVLADVDGDKSPF